jgi:hypothetical protein
MQVRTRLALIGVAAALTSSACLPQASRTGAADSDAEGSLLSAAKGSNGGQASLSVLCGPGQICHATNTEWTLEKTGALDAGRVTWSVSATPEEESRAFVTFQGTLTVSNTGAASATIGSIVVNLQRKSGKSFVTVASDIAGATGGDGAASARICSGASSEARSSFT